MLENIKLIAFDLDDTMVAFDLVTSKSWHQVCKDYHKKNPSINYDTFYNTIMDCYKWYWSDPERHKIGRHDIINTRRTVLKDVFDKLKIRDDGAALVVADEYSRVRIDNMYLLKEVYNTLETIRKKYQTVIITNGDSAGQRAKINRFELAKFFDGIYVEEEMGFGKPDNRVFEKVMQTHEVRPEECLMLGDNPTWDIIAPGKLGWKTAFVNTRKIEHDFSDYRPDFVLDHAYEIVDYLL